MKELLKYQYPIVNGVINNWSDMETIWKSIYSNLSIAQTEVYLFYMVILISLSIHY